MEITLCYSIYFEYNYIQKLHFIIDLFRRSRLHLVVDYKLHI